MNRLSRHFCLLAALAVGSTPVASWAQEVTVVISQKSDQGSEVTKSKKKPFKGKRPAVDIAILLDTSNSMDGLIAQAKTQLWNIVLQFAEAKKNGKTPMLRVAVFEYGNSGLPASEDYIRQVVKLTDDMDKVSEALFALRTNGGDEYCGAVIKEAIKRLDWSSEPNGYKAIFIAGNEPFTQGSVSYEESCHKAIQKGIVVNTIHCGDYATGVEGKWKHGAEIAEGEFMNINQDRKIAQIKTPQDDIIIRLNAELNRTYLWYGAVNKRKAYAANQIAQDNNALSAGSSISRIGTKAGKAYWNRGRDLVDSMTDEASILDTLDVTLLPEAMQNMTLEERKAHVKKLAAKRAEIQKKIVAATRQRDAFIAEQRKAMPVAAADTFGDVVEEAVAEQLDSFGFDVE